MGQSKHLHLSYSASEQRRSEALLRIARALEQEPRVALGDKSGPISMLHGSISALTANQRAWMSYLAAASVYGLVLFLITHV
jgi:hypothetical protein